MVSTLFHFSPLPNSKLLFCKTPYVPFHPSPIFPILSRNFSRPGFGQFGSRRHLSGLSNTKLCWPASAASWPCYLNDVDFDVELGRLLALLPEEMRQRISEHPELHHLIEVVMDLGRKPLARFPSGDFILWDRPITIEDLEQAISQVGDFAVDNRAGISRTLHRISAIRNRKGTIIGLTCRVGRALSGSAHLLRDLIKDGASLLLIGPPGVGKTTIIRDIARMLADDYKKRVMIVDTSNEIGGDGDIPHTGIGSARRMQVPHSDVQHKVLIEAVENHMPQVIVIDEIGNKLEALAASTIAQRGIQLVATAHGVSIENLVMNPALEMLVGGVESVTLGDEEASRRGVQKTVLERKGPSTFHSAVEIISKRELRVHRSVEATVDAILTGRYPRFEILKIDQDAEVEIQESSLSQDSLDTNETMPDNNPSVENKTSMNLHPNDEEKSREDGGALSIFLYGISEASVVQGLKQLKVNNEFAFTDNISEADALLALQSRLKKNSRIQSAARSHGIPVYVTKASSLAQLTKVIQALITDYEGVDFFDYEVKANESEKKDALEEARAAIEGIVIPEGEPVELLPRAPSILLLQKDLIRKYRLSSERVGNEPHVRLRIIPFRTTDMEDDHINEVQAHFDHDDDNEEDHFLKSATSETNGSAYMVDRLPLLEEL